MLHWRLFFAVLSSLSSLAVSKTPAEIILSNVYAHSCRLEAVISRLRPSCRLYDRETDTPSYVALCSSSLVANESLNLLSCDLSDLEKLTSMNHPKNSKIVSVGAEPLESLLRLIPVEVREELPLYVSNIIT